MAPSASIPHTKVIDGQVYAGHVNISSGAVPTEERGIFIHGLDYKVSTGELKVLLSQAGKVVSVELVGNGRKKKTTGKAKAEFATPEEAQFAVQILDGRNFRNRTLKVRLDKETVSAPVQSCHLPGPIGPIIANGSSSRSN